MTISRPHPGVLPVTKTVTATLAALALAADALSRPAARSGVLANLPQRLA